MKYLVLIITLLFFSCSSTRPLKSSGLSKEEREFYVIQNGWGMTQVIKDNFRDGIPCLEMTEENIFSLFGPPSQKMYKNGEKIWYYYDIVKKDLILRARIHFDTNGRVNGMFLKDI